MCETMLFTIFLSPHFPTIPTKEIYPPQELVFEALNACPVQAVKVCVLKIVIEMKIHIGHHLLSVLQWRM